MLQDELARYRRRKKRIITTVMTLVVVMAVLLTVFFTVYVSSYTITGNNYVEAQEIAGEIFETPMEQRYFYSFFRNLLHKNKKIPVLESYSMKFSPDLSVVIEVKEKEIAGGLVWNRSKYYFDDEGYVLAENPGKAEAVPVVEGLEFEEIIRYKRLEPLKSVIIDDVLRLIQLLKSEGIDVRTITYDESGSAIITMGDIKVKLGTAGSMAGKISELSDIIKSSGLQGLKGTLDMSSYDEGSEEKNFIFDREP